MESKQLLVTSSPHVFHRDDTRRGMFDVLFALTPAATLAIFFFGMPALLLILVTVVVSVLTEALIQRLSGRRITIRDGSVAVTGLLLAMNLPPELPLWTAGVGAVFAVAIGKHVFGGLGQNLFNPALVGRAVLLASWPALMTTWSEPFTLLTTATPLALMRGDGIATPYTHMFFGAIGGSLGETSAMALLLGGLYLLWRRVIDWRIPVTFLGTVAAFTWIFGGPTWFTGDPLFHMMAGGLMLGAWFMATDWVTSPVTKTGRLVMGIGCGLITSVIRLWGGYPEGVTYAILIMNAFTPLIDKYTQPRKFGGGRR